jgi:hypothetical protein
LERQNGIPDVALGSFLSIKFATSTKLALVRIGPYTDELLAPEYLDS